MKICLRLDEANRRIITSYSLWNMAKNNANFGYWQHIFANEQIIFLIRRTCDEIISLIWCLNYWKNNNKVYPPEIKCDCINDALSLDHEPSLILFKNNREILELINNLSNAFKHSFINSDINLLGRDDLCVHALALNHNNLSHKPVFYSVKLESVISGFNKFYKDSINWLRTFSVENHQN